jgi:hypothetical protein
MKEELTLFLIFGLLILGMSGCIGKAIASNDEIPREPGSVSILLGKDAEGNAYQGMIDPYDLLNGSVETPAQEQADRTTIQMNERSTQSSYLGGNELKRNFLPDPGGKF